MSLAMRHSPLLAAFALLAAPVWAGETPWQEVAPDVKLRLISTDEVDSSGTIWLGLEIDMPPSTKTYWRVPGDTGLPTNLDFSGSSGIEGHQIFWPFPVRDKTDRYLDYVYFGHTILPVQVKTNGSPMRAQVAATLGVCSEICIPAQASFTLELGDTAPDPASALRIRQSLAMAPIPWEGDPQPIGAVHYRRDEQALAVTVTGTEIDPISLIAATGSGEPLFGAPQKGREPGIVLLPVRGELDMQGQGFGDVQLTFMTGMGAYEVTRPIQMPPAD